MIIGPRAQFLWKLCTAGLGCSLASIIIPLHPTLTCFKGDHSVNSKCVLPFSLLQQWCSAVWDRLPGPAKALIDVSATWAAE